MSFIKQLSQLDVQLFLWLNAKHTSFSDVVFSCISNKFAWIPLYLYLLLLIVKKYRNKSWAVLIAIGILITITDQGSNILKKNIKRKRPCQNEHLMSQVHTVNEDCGSMYGFVSAHSANAVAMTTMIFLLLGFKNKFITSIMFIYCVTVPLSRIMLGRHYPLDVIGGGILGLLLAYTLYRILQKVVIKQEFEL